MSKPGDFGAFAPRVFERAAAVIQSRSTIVGGAARAIEALTRGVVALGAKRVALVGGVGEALRSLFRARYRRAALPATVRSDRWGDPVRRRRCGFARGSRAMKVLYGARMFDGERMHDDCALVVEGASIQALSRFEDRPRDGEQVDLGGGDSSAPASSTGRSMAAAACCSTPIRPSRGSPRSPPRIGAPA